MKFDINSTALLNHIAKMSGRDIPVMVNKLVNIVKRSKAENLDQKQFDSSMYLPKSLQAEQLKKEIFKINNKIVSISKCNHFLREHEFFENAIDENEIRNNKVVLLRLCAGAFDNNEYQQYINYNINEDELITVKRWYRRNFGKQFEITLPKFELVTDYLSLLEYYDNLISDFMEIENGGERVIPEKRYQLQTNLTDTQRGKLFDLLLSNKYIAPTTNKESFIWAFGAEKSEPTGWQQIEWIDKSTTRKEPNIQTLFELIYLLGVNKDTSANNPNNLYKKMYYCFSGFENISSKNPTKIQQKTLRQIQLKTILEDVEKVGA